MFIVIWGPIAAVYRLRWWAIPSFLPAFTVMGLGIGLDKTPGSPSPAAYVAACVSSACLGLVLLLWLFFGFFLDLERTYRFKPWKTQQDKAAAAAPGKPVLCPYTGLRPNFRCHSCETVVHETAFHFRDREMSFPVGDDVADWGKVQELMVNEPDTGKARMLVDEAVDWRSNYIWIAINDCCIGCEAWKKSFNLVPRHSLSLAFAGWFASFCVWGFSDALKDTGSIVAQVFTQTAGALYSCLAVTMLLQGYAMGYAFLESHSEVLNLEPHYRPTRSALVKLYARTLGGRWGKAMPRR